MTSRGEHHESGSVPPTSTTLLLGDEAAAGEVFDQGLVDRRAGELEVGEVLGEREPGDGELVFDRARLLLADLGGEQVADDPLVRAGV